ncbi:MAG: hypothetical protein MUC95_00925, partial [Spirochaetes bacterium]|nr:hypothetical protein [Spirochaetota bacterium]
MQRKFFLTDRLIYYITFFTGFSSAIIQAVLIREMLSVFRGNELLIGIIFSAWFLGIFIGARYNPESDILRLKRRVLLSLIFFPFVSVIMIYLPHSAAAIFPVPVGSFYSIKDEFLFSVVLTVPASFFAGYIFPPLVSLISDKTGWKSGGRIYYIEAFGGFAGGLLFSFIFIDILNPLALCSIIIFAGIILFAAAVKNYKFCVLLLVPLILFISSGKIEKIFFSYMWEHSHPGRMLEYRRTKYQTVTAESGVDSVSIYGDGIYFYTLPDRYEARMLFHLLQSLTVKSNVDILLTGAAPGSLLSNFLRSDTGNLTYIEMDSGLWEIADKYRRIYYPAENENRLKIIKSDLRHYFSATDKKFDMIVCLPPPPENAMLNRYYTREFYSMCRDHLKTGGVFVTSIFGFSNYISPVLMRYMRSVYRS